MNDTEIMHELAANMLLVSSVNIFFFMCWEGQHWSHADLKLYLY